MTFQLSLFLYIYIAFLVFWAVFFIIAIYHMARFGFKNVTTLLSMLIFLGVAILMLNVSLGYITEIDWETEVKILENIINHSSPLSI